MLFAGVIAAAFDSTPLPVIRLLQAPRSSYGIFSYFISHLSKTSSTTANITGVLYRRPCTSNAVGFIVVTIGEQHNTANSGRGKSAAVDSTLWVVNNVLLYLLLIDRAM